MYLIHRINLYLLTYIILLEEISMHTGTYLIIYSYEFRVVSHLW